MAAITLRTLWLSDAAAPLDFVSFPFMAKLVVLTARQGEVRRYAGGRRRAVTRVGTDRTVQVDLPNCDRAQIDWLETHAGRLLLARDDRGRKMYGTFFDFAPDEHSYDENADVSLVVAEVSFSEYV